MILTMSMQRVALVTLSKVKIPMALARKLSEELANDLAEYDAKVAEKAAEKELAESSEN